MTPIETVQALTALARAMTKNFAFTADRAGEVAALLNAGDALATTMAAQETAASRATDEAEFEMHCNGEPEAKASGPRAQAWREIQHYAAMYAQDGTVEIFEIKRVLVTSAAGEGMPK